MLAPLSAVGITRYHRPDGEWTKRRQAFDRNPHLSLRAFRVASYVLSHAEGFVQTERAIARGCGISVTTVRAAIADLVADRYIVKRRIREHGRWIGTAYAVSDRQFTPEEVAQLSAPGAESLRTDSERSESVRPKKTTPVRETTSGQEDQTPSGGPAGAAPSVAADDHQENAMTKRRGPEPDLVLFEDLQPVQAEPAARAGGQSAATVVAAYVDSHRRNHGGDPLQRDKGRVARDAAGMLHAGQASVTELVAAATELGQGPWANLGVQLKKIRERTAPANPARGRVNAIPASDPRWQVLADKQEAEHRERMANDPEYAARAAAFFASAGSAGVA